MRRLALLLNIAVLLFFGFYTIRDGLDGYSTVGIVSLILVVAAAGVSLVALKSGSIGWLDLYFRRKQLEESRRIAELQDGS